MATASPLNVMTLGPQQKAMSSLMQPTASNAGCVMVGGPQGQPAHLSPHQAASKAVLLQQRRALAPADARGAVVMAAAAPAANASASDMLRCKRRINFSHNPHLTYAPGHQPASVARRNARERNRVKQVNNGFATLRSRIPVSVAAALSSAASPAPSGGRGASKKLSKVETLRMAVEYIRSLQQLLEDHATETASTASSSGSSTTPEPSGGALSAAAGSDTGYYSSSPESGVALLAGTHYAGPAAPVGPAPPHPLLAPPSMPLAGTQLSPPCSEASSSPTPSYASEGSGSAGSAGSAYAPPSVYQQDTYENYEPMSPEDEELLDVISWWQQSQ